MRGADWYRDPRTLLERRRQLFVLLALVALAAGAYLWVDHSAAGEHPGSTFGPSRGMLTSMAADFEKKYGPRFLAGVNHPPKLGCAAEGMDQWGTDTSDSVVYAEVFCQTCPPVVYAGATPAAFVVSGSTVSDIDAPTATDKPTLDEQVQAIFPQDLWDVAESSKIANLDQLRASARLAAGC